MISRLKGKDAHQVRHMLRGCEEDSQFYMLLGNMEHIVTEPNEGDDEDHYPKVILKHVVDVSGFELLDGAPLIINQNNLLRQVYNEHRGPDTQRGGGYMGNSHADLDQVYKDSASVVKRPGRARYGLTIQLPGRDYRSAGEDHVLFAWWLEWTHKAERSEKGR